MTKEVYRTIKESAEGIYKEKSSKFFSYAFPVTDEESIKQKLKELRKIHHDAGHHCFAWRLGPEGASYRINDDQEPSGTAGKPIHGQLISFDVTDILLVVARYFGGTLLGTGGLRNAYRAAALDALNKAVIIEKQVMRSIMIRFPYVAMNEVMKIIRGENAIIIEQRMELCCSAKIEIPKRNYQSAIQKFSLVESLEIET